MEHRWKVLLLISVGSFMAFLDAPVVSVAFPAIQHSFSDTARTTLAWVLDGYFIGFAALLVLAGRLADRFGRRSTFLAGMCVFTLASLGCAVAPSADALIAARVLQALGAAIVVPAGQGLMLAAFPPQQLKTAIGALAAIIGLAVALAPTIGAVVVDDLGWRWIFYINLFIGAATIAWALALLKRDEPQRAAPMPDWLGAALQAGALGLFVLAILRRSEWGTGDPRTIAAFAVAVLALGAFIARCRRHPSPVIDLALFRNPTFAAANLASLVFAMGFYAVTINAVLFLTAAWHYSVIEVGLAFLPGSLIGAVLGSAAGRVAERRGSRVVSVAGSLLAAAGLVLIVLSTGAEANFLRDWLPGSLLYGAGVFIGLTGLVGAALTSAPPAQFALASGINAGMRQVGGAIGVALMVAITSEAGADLVGRAHLAFYVAAGALLAGGVVASRMPSPVLDAQQAAATDARLMPETVAG